MSEPRLREIPGRGWFAHLADWGAEERAEFYAAAESEQGARAELAAAVEAWREERGERMSARNRASWDWVEES